MPEADPFPNDDTIDYSAARVPIRQDLRDTHARVLDAIRRPGTWLDGAQRVAVAEESRRALACALCRERKAALSPEHVQGEHDAATDLPAPLVEAIHRIRSDPARLSRSWFEKTLAAGVAAEAYVETVGVVTELAGLDFFCRAVGLAPFALPEPLPGEPTRRRPAGTKEGIAWVPLLAPEDATGPEADLYAAGPVVPNIARALSLVPMEVRLLQTWMASHYVPLDKLQDPTLGRDLDRLQIELVASRVSAINECFY